MYGSIPPLERNTAKLIPLAVSEHGLLCSQRRAAGKSRLDVAGWNSIDAAGSKRRSSLEVISYPLLTFMLFLSESQRSPFANDLLGPAASDAMLSCTIQHCCDHVPATPDRPIDRCFCAGVTWYGVGASIKQQLCDSNTGLFVAFFTLYEMM